MERNNNFYFNYHRDYSGNHHVFKVFSKECFNETRKQDYERSGVFDGDIIEHRLAGVDEKYDPRIYGVIKSYDGKVYAVSFNDNYNYDKIIAHEGLDKDAFVDTKVIPIEELSDDYEVIPSATVTNGFSGPSNKKYEPYDQCHNYISTDVPMYEIDEMYLIVMRLTAYQYRLYKEGKKNLVVSGDSEFLHRLECSAFSLFGHVMFDKSKYDFRHIGGYNPDQKGIILCRKDVAEKYVKFGHEVIRFDSEVRTEEGKGRGRKKNNDRH